MSEKRSENVSVMVTPSVLAEIEAIMKHEDRSKSWVAGVLLERGLHAFRKDGLLRSKSGKLGMASAKAEKSDDTRRKKNE